MTNGNFALSQATPVGSKCKHHHAERIKHVSNLDPAVHINAFAFGAFLPSAHADDAIACARIRSMDGANSNDLDSRLHVRHNFSYKVVLYGTSNVCCIFFSGEILPDKS